MDRIVVVALWDRVAEPRLKVVKYFFWRNIFFWVIVFVYLPIINN